MHRDEMLAARQALQDNPFDGFDYIRSLRALCTQQGSNYAIPHYNIVDGRKSGYVLDVTGYYHMVDFHRLYYVPFGEAFLREALTSVKEEGLRHEIEELLEYHADFVEYEQGEFESFLFEIDSQDTFPILKRYVPFINAGIVLPLIKDNKGKLTPAQLVRYAGIMACYIMWDANCDVEENVETFAFVAQTIENNLGSDERATLFNQLSQYNRHHNFDFPQSSEEAVAIERQLVQHKQCNADGTIYITWDYVEFGQGYLLLYHPLHPKEEGGTPVRINAPQATPIFNHITSLFRNRCYPIKVVCEDGKITKIVDLPNISQCVEQLMQHTQSPDFELLRKEQAMRPTTLSPAEAKTVVKDKDSQYLTFLSEHHLTQLKAYRCREVQVHSDQTPADEEAFMFVVGQNEKSYYIVFENTSPNRATIVFEVLRDSLDKAVLAIHRYFASRAEVNKREKLRCHRVRFTNSGITAYHHIIHTGWLYDWKYKISEYI